MLAEYSMRKSVIDVDVEKVVAPNRVSKEGDRSGVSQLLKAKSHVHVQTRK